MSETDLKSTIDSEAFAWGNAVADSYHGVAKDHMNRQWAGAIQPFIEKFDFDLTKVVDFAAGFGRNTTKLIEQGARFVTMVDVNPECIDYLNKNVVSSCSEAVINNGYDLSKLESNSYTFFYTFDAMVHFDLQIVLAYMPEIYRVLKEGGFALIHHSNFTERPGSDFRTNPHWRNFMSAQIFSHIGQKAGFKVIEQKEIDWGLPKLDCISILRK